MVELLTYDKLKEKVEDIDDTPGIYNHIYDLMFTAGVPISLQRVDDLSQSAGGSDILRLVKEIDSAAWARICNRISGANTVVSYDGKLSRGDFEKPKHMTWKQYVRFLLKHAVSKKLAQRYVDRIQKFLKWSFYSGSGCPENIIQELEEKYPGWIKRTGALSTRGAKDKEVIRFRYAKDSCPEDLNYILPTWRLFAYTIQRGDVYCKGLGFGPTTGMTQREKELLMQIENMRDAKK